MTAWRKRIERLRLLPSLALAFAVLLGSNGLSGKERKIGDWEITPGIDRVSGKKSPVVAYTRQPGFISFRCVSNKPTIYFRANLPRWPEKAVHAVSLLVDGSPLANLVGAPLSPSELEVPLPKPLPARLSAAFHTARFMEVRLSSNVAGVLIRTISLNGARSALEALKGHCDFE